MIRRGHRHRRSAMLRSATSRPRVLLPLPLALVAPTGCHRAESQAHRLPTGVVLDPAGHSVALGSMPVAMVFSPDSSRGVAVLSGYREQGAQVVDLASARVVQT